MLGRSKSSGAFPQPWEAAGAVAVMAALFVFSAMPTPVLAGLAPAPGIEVATRPTGDIPTDERRGGKPSPLILRALPSETATLVSAQEVRNVIVLLVMPKGVQHSLIEGELASC